MTIVCDRLGRRFGRLRAVDGLSFRTERHEVLGLLGPNGAGKTTTIRMLTTALTPSAGTASVAGHDIRAAPLQVRRTIGFLAEDVPLPRDATVEEILSFHADLYGLDRPARRRRTGELCDRLDLMALRRRRFGTLSKGQRQRVGIAAALVPAPPVVILDEPTIGLDPAQVIAVRALIRELGAAHTVLFSSHILSEVQAAADRVLILQHGRCLALEAIDGLATRMRVQPRLSVRTGPTDPGRLRELLLRHTGVAATPTADGQGWRAQLPANPAVAPELARALCGAGIALRELRIDEPTLEDIFLGLVAGAASGAGAGDGDG